MNAHDMEKTIEIPEGYEARIEGSKVILEKNESEDEKIRKAIESIIRVYGKTQGEWIAGYDMDTLVVHLRDAFASLERQKEKPICLSTGARKRLIETIYSDIEEVVKGAEKRLSYFPFLKSHKEQKPVPAEDEKDFLEKEVKAFLCNYDNEFDDDAPTYDIAEHFYQLGKNSQQPAEDKDAIEVTPKQDYSGLTDFERAIHRGFLCAGVENVPVGIIKDTAQDCLAQIKPAEWSDVEKMHLANAILAAEKEWGVDSYTVKFLESLRPSWKPSEEQISAIVEALKYIPNNKEEWIILENLMDDLKKLSL